DPGEQPGLAQKTFRRDAGKGDLDGHVHVQRPVAGAINDAHTAATDLVENLVARRQFAAQGQGGFRISLGGRNSARRSGIHALHCTGRSLAMSTFSFPRSASRVSAAFSFPRSAWECRVWDALRPECQQTGSLSVAVRDAERRTQCVPTRSVGTRVHAERGHEGSFSLSEGTRWRRVRFRFPPRAPREKHMGEAPVPQQPASVNLDAVVEEVVAEAHLRPEQLRPEERAYLKEHALKKPLRVLDIWALGVGVVIAGEYFGWNLGLRDNGPVAMLIASLVVCLLYLMWTLALSELSVAMPFAGGPMAYGRRT